MKAFKIVCVICILALIGGLAYAIISDKTSVKEPEEKTVDNSDIRIVALGDSIAEGVLGPSPLIEREDYTYLSVVGQINGFTYRNRSISGHTTSDLLEYVLRESDDTAYATITNLKQADVITISILGNDLLQVRFTEYLKSSLKTPADYSEVDELLEKSYQNIKLIVERLKVLNSDAQIIFQTVYNPLHIGSTLVNAGTKQYIKEQFGIDEEGLYEAGGRLIARMNNVLYRYKAEDPCAFSIIDVNEKFDVLYRAKPERLKRLIYTDSIHPSNEGHAVIAALLQERLEDLGIADHDYALTNYKKMKNEQIARLYSDTDVDVAATQKAIDNASTYDQINEIYFDAVDGITPVYTASAAINSSKEEKKFVEEDIYYYFDDATLWNIGLEDILDKDNTYVLLKANGEAEIRFTPSKFYLNLINIAIAGVSNSDPNFAINVGPFEVYIKEFFPGKSYDDIEDVLKIMEIDIGTGFDGIDFENEGIQRLIQSLKEYKTVIPSTTIPQDFSLVIKSTYTLKEIPSVTQDEPWRAVYIGDYTELGEPYVVLTMFEDEDGVESIRVRNEVLKLDVVEKVR